MIFRQILRQVYSDNQQPMTFQDLESSLRCPKIEIDLPSHEVQVFESAMIVIAFAVLVYFPSNFALRVLYYYLMCH